MQARPVHYADSSDLEPPASGGRRHRRAHVEKRGLSVVEIYTDGACRGNPGPVVGGRCSSSATGDASCVGARPIRQTTAWS